MTASMSALSKLRTIWRPARAGGVIGRAGAAWAVGPRRRRGGGRTEGRGDGRPALRLGARRGGGQGGRPLGRSRCHRRRGHGHGRLGGGRGCGPAGSGAGAPAEHGEPEDRDPAARQRLRDHSSSVGCSCVSVLGGGGSGIAGRGRPGGRMPVVGAGGDTGGLAAAGRPAPPASGDCTPGGAADWRGFEGSESSTSKVSPPRRSTTRSGLICSRRESPTRSPSEYAKTRRFCMSSR